MIAFLLGNWRLLAIAGALLGLFGVGHHLGAKSVQADWDAAKVEALAAQQRADEQAARTANHAAMRYEEQKAAQAVRVVTVVKEINRALETQPLWSSGDLPASVRDAIATASQALATAQPDSAVPVSAAGSANERSTGPSLRLGDPKPRRLFGATP